MQERKLAKWSEMVEKGLKPVFVMMKPQEHWHLMRTLASNVESGPFNLKEIGDNFSVDIEKPLKPVMDQWIKAGLLKSRETSISDCCRPVLVCDHGSARYGSADHDHCKRRFFQSGSDYAKRIFTQPSRSVVKNYQQARRITEGKRLGI